MDHNADIEGCGEDEFHGQRGREYRPVLDEDRAVLEVSSMDPSGSSSSPPVGLKKINASSQVNMSSNREEGYFPTHTQANGPRRDSKLELFGFDSLVNILGLKSMTGEQVQAPLSPRDGEDISITRGQPKPNDVKLGTMMGVFIPCLQNILGIIYYIRFTW